MRQVVSFFNRFLQGAEWKISLWSLVFGPGGLMASTALAVWAVWATDALALYAPFSYVAALILTPVLLAAGYLMYAKAAERRQFVRFREIAFEVSHINPMEDVFRKQRIRVIDLAAPIGGQIKGKTFNDCDLIGPVNVMFSNNCTFHGNSGNGVDGLIVREEKFPTNGFGFDACAFRNCRFYLMTFMVPETQYPYSAFQHWSGINWITDLPGQPASLQSDEASDSQSPQGILEKKQQ